MWMDNVHQTLPDKSLGVHNWYDPDDCRGTPGKVVQKKEDSRIILNNVKPTVQAVASLLGQYVSAAEAVPYATIH